MRALLMMGLRSDNSSNESRESLIPVHFSMVISKRFSPLRYRAVISCKDKSLLLISPPVRWCGEHPLDHPPEGFFSIINEGIALSISGFYVDDPICFIYIDKLGVVVGVLLLVEEAIVGDDDDIVLARLVGGSTIDADDSGIAFPFNSIGFKAVSVGHIVDLDLFERVDIRGFHQGFVYGDTTLVVEVGIGYLRPMDFGLQHNPLHFILTTVRGIIEEEKSATIDYAKICDAHTLEDIEEIKGEAIIAVAVQIGKTRLIDNLILKEE